MNSWLGGATAVPSFTVKRAGSTQTDRPEWP